MTLDHHDMASSDPSGASNRTQMQPLLALFCLCTPQPLTLVFSPLYCLFPLNQEFRSMSDAAPPLDEAVLAAVRTAMKTIKVAGHHDRVYKEECCYSFDTPESPEGLFVNLTTLQVSTVWTDEPCWVSSNGTQNVACVVWMVDTAPGLLWRLLTLRVACIFRKQKDRLIFDYNQML